MTTKSPVCSIGGFDLTFPFVLAPLAGITSAPFRRMCSEQGAGLTYTEMISAKGMYYDNKNTDSLLATNPDEGPVGIQIFGSEPDLIGFAAQRLAGHPGVLLDINMGCPVPKVVKHGEGSALLLKPDRRVGILGYGAYVPRYRLPAKEIARIWGAGDEGLPVIEKAVAGLDEDVITMSIEAARNALKRAGIDPMELRAVWVGSESHPYAVKPSGTIVAEAIGASTNIQAGDWEFACKAGSEAVSYTHLRAHETVLDLVCRLLLEKKKTNISQN